MDPVQSGGPWTRGPCFVLTPQIHFCEFWEKKVFVQSPSSRHSPMRDTWILFIVVEADLRFDEFHWAGVVPNCTMGQFRADEFGPSLQRNLLTGYERSDSVTIVDPSYNSTKHWSSLMRSLETAGKLHTHFSPYPTLCPKFEVIVNIGVVRGRASSQNLRLIRHKVLEYDRNAIWLSRRRWNPSTCQIIYTNGPIWFLDLNRKVKRQNSCPFFFFFWLQLKGYSFSALELKLDQEVVLCKGDIQKTVCTIKRALGPKNYKESLRCVQEQSPNIKVKHQSPNSK